ncbi:ankyrin repeat domain-containing protein [Burkholderia contaminans]|uniref:Ankyrin repeat domain-containing protein n=1 Tax=Burkholderia contaminans TaxID=488447 RepID=A0A3N8NZF4_9BURK|nr:ankyrin repeat domain-containing protein [Burkholderia contaminans]RQT04365.1 ankyrin repeat domain-containing protein [Burkholderia contaminans]
MSTLNDELYDQHDDEDDLDDDLDDDEDHALDSDIALDRFTDRAMRHGRRAATWLLVGAVAEVAVLAGLDCIEPSLSKWLILPVVVTTVALMLTIVVPIYKRWNRHRAKMESVIGEAMGWRSDVQQKERDKADATARYYRGRAEEERIEALREELTWNVGPAAVYIDAEGQRHPTTEQIALERVARREFGDLFDSLDGPDDQADDDTESDTVPAVQAWTQRWAGLEPVHQPRPARLVKRHSDAEGRRLERELCRAINKHWTGAFHTLLDQGVNPNGHNNSGRPLRIAVLRGRLEYVSWLLTLGADVTTLCHGRTILSALMCQVADYIDEGDGEGDDFVWPEKLELLARWGADPHQMNRWYDEDDDSEGPNAWPFITRWPVLYEAFMKGRQVWLQSDADAMRLLRDGRESVGLAEVADTTRAMLDAARMGRA